LPLEENKSLVRRYFEDAPHDPDVCEQIFAPSFQFHTIQQASVTPQVMTSTPEDEKAAYDQLRKVWGDWKMVVDEMIAEGDRVMVRWTFQGTHQDELAGLPPTHKQVTYCGINIFRIANGKIAEIWDISDRLWMWQQLGVLPELKDAIGKSRDDLLSQAE
jgi:steroid delta-isomerase-like uncharacterized protein